jgi:hypothetical protein
MIASQASLTRSQRFARAARRHVAPVEERVHGDARYAGRRGEVDHREDVGFMAVHATGREQAEHVQAGVRIAGRATGAEQGRIACEAAIGNRRVNAGQVLVDHATRTDVHVAHLGIAHLALGQADLEAVGIDEAVRTLGEQAPPVRAAGHGDGIVRRLLAMAPAIEDQQQDRFGSGHGLTRAWEMPHSAARQGKW